MSGILHLLLQIKIAPTNYRLISYSQWPRVERSRVTKCAMSWRHEKGFPAATTVQSGSGAHPASYWMGTEGSFYRGKAAGTWSYQPPLSSAKVKNGEWYLHCHYMLSWSAQEQLLICLLVSLRFICRHYIIIYRVFTIFHHSSSIHYPPPADLNYQAHAMR
jgi:hypothetical protein